MKRSLFALLALAFLPSLAHAAGLKGQLAAEVRSAPKVKKLGIKIDGRSMKTEALNGAFGAFSETAYKPGKVGLAPTIYNINGGWKKVNGAAKITKLTIKLAPAQPLAEAR